jgi:hypothetical protein
MKSIKIASLVAGISLLAATFVPGTVSAASATMSLSGATQTNGTFSTIVYENSDGPVTSVSLAMSFSTTVSNVAYDYSVGPFTTTDPSGGHLVQGSVTGSQPVARVSFALANPGAVTASVNTASSYLKGVSGTSIVYYTMSPAGAAFTYNAPAQGGMGGGSNAGSTTSNTVTTTTTTPGRNTATAQNTNTTATTTTTPAADDKSKTDVKADTTKQANNDTKKETFENTSGKKHSVWPWILLVIVAVAAVAYALRNRVSGAAEKKAEEAKVVKPATDKAAKGAQAAAATDAATAQADPKKKPVAKKAHNKKNR